MPPRLPAALVERERLLRQLDGAFNHRLTVLAASAGWGKTTLLTSFAERMRDEGGRIKPKQYGDNAAPAPIPHPSSLIPHVAWLSLDECDDEPTAFWLAVTAALHAAIPAVGATPLAMLQAPEPAPLHTAQTVLLNELAALPEPAPLLLILDDYHQITQPAVHESLAYLLERLPDHLHLILATRVDPDLPLARWRVRGELLELRVRDLRFSEAEASTFFAQTLGDVLTAGEVLQLAQRTEGWAAGLQLAALALRQQADPSSFVQRFSGSHRFLLDYVQEEILARQPPHIQRFLLHTAVLRRISADLAAALTGELHSQATLEWLERQQLFVVPLDDGSPDAATPPRRWYRTHDLFREVLLARLEATEPARIPELHRRAAGWYADHGEEQRAISHALAAVDFELAAELIGRVAPRLWLRGEVQAVHQWVAALPDETFWQHSCLALDAALRRIEAALLGAQELWESAVQAVEATLARLDAGLLEGQLHTLSGSPAGPPLDAPEVGLLRRRSGLLRALIATRAALHAGDQECMRRLAEQAEQLAADEAPHWVDVALTIAFRAVDTLRLDGALLIPRLEAARQQAIDVGDRITTERVLRRLALLYLRAGKLRLTEQVAHAGLQLIRDGGAQSISEGYFQFFASHVAYEWNDLEATAQLNQVALTIGQRWQQVNLQLVARVGLAQLRLAQGEPAAAHAQLLAIEQLLAPEPAALHREAVNATWVQYWLVVGDWEAVQRWAAQQRFTPATWQPNQKWALLMLVRVFLVQRQYAQAQALLEPFHAALDRPGDVATTLEFLALDAVARYHSGQQSQARAMALRLLALTAPDDYLRLFLDIGTAMRRLLEHLAATAGPRLAPESAAQLARVLAAFEGNPQRAERKAQGDAASPGLPMVVLRSNVSPLERFAEPLTPREREVLRLLLTGASNHVIADSLVIALPTVKKHVSNILGKLGLESRAQVIVYARERPELTA